MGLTFTYTESHHLHGYRLAQVTTISSLENYNTFLVFLLPPYSVKKTTARDISF